MQKARAAALSETWRCAQVQDARIPRVSGLDLAIGDDAKREALCARAVCGCNGHQHR